MLYYENLLYSLYEIKEYAELMNKHSKTKTIRPENVQYYTARIIEHAKAAISEVNGRMAVEDLTLKKGFEEVTRREITDEDKEGKT